jgi:hypothetical protein
MDVATHVNILRLQSEHLSTLADTLRIQLVMMEQALAEQAQPSSSHVIPSLAGLLELDQQIVREMDRLHARIEELVAKSNTGSAI